MLEKTEKPCLTKAKQGFSVIYQNRQLYSKYDPIKTISSTIESLDILPDTLILCYSPVLFLCNDKLQKKIDSSCFILFIEKDLSLFNFSLSYLPTSLKNSSTSHYLQAISNLQVLSFIDNLFTINHKVYKRTVVIEMSAGIAFNREFYLECTKLIDNYISVFWKNRITINRLGRLFSSNLFKNIQKITNSTYTPLIKKSIRKQILVVGAGPSSDFVINEIAKKALDFFIICVDVATSLLTDYEITPDIIITMESQQAIDTAFIGFSNSKTIILKDFTSRSNRDICGINTRSAWFISEYCNEPFLKSFINLLTPDLGIPVFVPLGSVGLTAVETALYLREDNVPIYISGLDFSFCPGKTHCKSTPAQKRILNSVNRLNTIERINSAYKQGTIIVKGKSFYTSNNSHDDCVSDPALLNYSKMFCTRYSKTPLLFDISPSGIESNLPKKIIKDIEIYKSISIQDSIELIKTKTFTSSVFNKYIQKEHSKLLKIRLYLTHQEKNKDNLINTNKDLQDILESCSYLYIHFPDAEKGLRLSSDFLNRIRAEIDYFLKITQNINKPEK